VSVVHSTTANVAIQNFWIGPSLSNRIETSDSNSNLEASQIPTILITLPYKYSYLLTDEFLVDKYLWQNMCKLRCLVLPIKLQCLSARRVCSKLVSVFAHFIHPSASSCELHCQGCITRTWKYRLPCRMPALFNCLLAVLAAGTLVTRHYFIINFRFSLL